MHADGLLRDLVLVYGVAVALLVVAGRLRVPAIVALIGAGIIAGPFGAAVVETKAEVDLLSEIGIALLLFMAGLEFSIAGLREAWRGVVIGGVAQVALTAAIVAGIASQRHRRHASSWLGSSWRCRARPSSSRSSREAIRPHHPMAGWRWASCCCRT